MVPRGPRRTGADCWRSPGAATPLPHVGRRERQAAEANIEYGIELAAGAETPEELGLEPTAIERLIGGHYGHPDGVYHA